MVIRVRGDIFYVSFLEHHPEKFQELSKATKFCMACWKKHPIWAFDIEFDENDVNKDGDVSWGHVSKYCHNYMFPPKQKSWKSRFIYCTHCGLFKNDPKWILFYLSREREGICKQCKRHHSLLLKNKRRFRAWAYGSIRSHKVRGFIVNIEIDELAKRAMDARFCYYCNCELFYGYGKGHQPYGATLDRIHNGKILTLEDTQIICRRCNSTKNKYTEAQFIHYCKSIAKRF